MAEMTIEPEHKLKIRWAGPGVIMAVSGIGASDVIAATVGGVCQTPTNEATTAAQKPME